MPIGKHKPLHRIDAKSSFTGGGAVEATAASYAPPAIKSIPEPEDLVLDSGIGRSAVTPTAYITAVWSRPSGSVPQSYIIQVSEDSTFPDGETTAAPTLTESATLDKLKTATLYYVRVAAVYRSIQSGWSDTASETTPADTVPPSPVTSAAADFTTGDLVLTWTNPTSDNLKDVEVDIYASNGGALLLTDHSATGSYILTAVDNLRITAGAGDPTLYIRLRARSYGNVYSTNVFVSATKTAPTAPAGLTTSWAGDTGTAGPDCTISWTAANYIRHYVLTIDGTARQVAGTANRYTYSLDTNRAEHSGTPDPALSITIAAVDRLLQSSTNSSTTATNAAPATPTATLEQGAVSGLHATVTSTPPADFLAYEFVFKRESTTVATVVTPQASAAYPMQGAGDTGYHSWTVVIRQKDAFGQFSATVTPAAVAFEALTLAGIRALIGYTDSLGTAPATLKTAFADGNVSSGGVSYAA